MVAPINLNSLEPIEEDLIYEHVFDLYTERAPPEHLRLGYIDRQSDSIEITLRKAEISFNIKQSLSELAAKGSTTGFVVWKTSQCLLDWILTTTECPLYGIFSHKSDAIVYELGSGIAGILAAALGPRCLRYVATDQKHLLKLLKSNFICNVQSTKYTSSTLDQESANSAKGFRKGKQNPGSKRSTVSITSRQQDPVSNVDESTNRFSNIDFIEYDWEYPQKGLDQLKSLYPGEVGFLPPDFIFAVDTIYNEYLIPYFITAAKQLMDPNHTVLVVGMQLRDESILEIFLQELKNQKMSVYLIPFSMLSEDLQKGYVIYFITLPG
ncbi:uncharacterized protein KQ657_002207 [Scheffersomyces spartinae]|uniref:Ribosomal lysine N-methyltransferase 5 n=1 Tax=Scheffersomyces spartinae TaxID=45513 RepID=A0A9P7VDR6_9ASCO|nr:uncharacterized protein KQ657_002207 [Scheffersomyces spartinae]KAG7195822.1 hypothetical protein KQ657_002207 [Scheffersomyces spartinae]